MRLLTRAAVAILVLLTIAIGIPNVMFAQEAEAAVEGGGAALAVLSGALIIVGPTIVAIISVPAFDLFKLVTSLKGKLPAWVQQLMVPMLAFGLTWLGALTNTILPESLELFTAGHTTALLSAAMAFGIKAGKQAKTASPT